MDVKALLNDSTIDGITVIKVRLEDAGERIAVTPFDGKVPGKQTILIRKSDLDTVADTDDGR